MCMVYFHSIDVVLGRTDVLRRAWSARCHLPKVLFHPLQGRKPRRGRLASKCHDYSLFRRMIFCKDVVYKNHARMFHLYEKYCDEASLTKYWRNNKGDDSDDEEPTIAAAETTNEVVDDDEF